MGQVTWNLVVSTLVFVLRLRLSLNLSFSRASSGLKLHVQNLRTLALNLGSHTTAPLASIGVSLNYGTFTTLNVSQGVNTIFGGSAALQLEGSDSVVRLNVEGWQDNRINLESISLNSVRISFKLAVLVEQGKLTQT